MLVWVLNTTLELLHKCRYYIYVHTRIRTQNDPNGLKAKTFDRIQSNWIQLLNIDSNFTYKVILYSILIELLDTKEQFYFVVLERTDSLPCIARMS